MKWAEFAALKRCFGRCSRWPTGSFSSFRVDVHEEIHHEVIAYFHRLSWFKLLRFLCFAAHKPTTTSVISHVLSITAPLSYTSSVNRPPLLITKKKEKLTSAVKKWTNAPCHTSDPRVKECKWKNDRLPRCSAICTFNFACLRSPVSEFQVAIVLSTYSLTCRTLSESALHCPTCAFCGN